MTEQIERADLARIYRAIGNSAAPMPVDVDIWVDHDHLDLRLPNNSAQDVNVWAKALRVKTERGGTTVSGGRTFHSYASVRTEWLGWKVKVKSFIDGPNPADRPRTPTAALGTGDEPGADPFADLYDCCSAAPTQPHTPDCGLASNAGSES